MASRIKALNAYMPHIVLGTRAEMSTLVRIHRPQHRCFDRLNTRLSESAIRQAMLRPWPQALWH